MGYVRTVTGIRSSRQSPAADLTRSNVTRRQAVAPQSISESMTVAVSRLAFHTHHRDRVVRSVKEPVEVAGDEPQEDMIVVPAPDVIDAARRLSASSDFRGHAKFAHVHVFDPCCSEGSREVPSREGGLELAYRVESNVDQRHNACIKQRAHKAFDIASLVANGVEIRLVASRRHLGFPSLTPEPPDHNTTFPLTDETDLSLEPAYPLVVRQLLRELRFSPDLRPRQPILRAAEWRHYTLLERIVRRRRGRSSIPVHAVALRADPRLPFRIARHPLMATTLASTPHDS